MSRVSIVTTEIPRGYRGINNKWHGIVRFEVNLDQKAFTYLEFLRYFRPNIDNSKPPTDVNEPICQEIVKSICGRCQGTFADNYVIEFEPFSRKTIEAPFVFYLVEYPEFNKLANLTGHMHHITHAYALRKEVSAGQVHLHPFYEDGRRFAFAEGDTGPGCIFKAHNSSFNNGQVIICAAKPIYKKIGGHAYNNADNDNYPYVPGRSPPLTMAMLMYQPERVGKLFNDIAFVILNEMKRGFQDKTIWLNSHPSDYENAKVMKETSLLCNDVNDANFMVRRRAVLNRSFWAWFRLDTTPTFILSKPLQERCVPIVGAQGAHHRHDSYSFKVCPRVYINTSLIKPVDRNVFLGKDKDIEDIVNYFYESKGDFMFDPKFIGFFEEFFTILDHDGDKKLKLDDFSNKEMKARFQTFIDRDYCRFLESRSVPEISEENFTKFFLHWAFVGRSDVQTNGVVSKGQIFHKVPVDGRDDKKSNISWVTRLGYLREKVNKNVLMYLRAVYEHFDIDCNSDFPSTEEIEKVMDEHERITTCRPQKTAIQLHQEDRAKRGLSVGAAGAQFAAPGSPQNVGSVHMSAYSAAGRSGGSGNYPTGSSSGIDSSDDVVVRNNGETDLEFELIELFLDDEDTIFMDSQIHQRLKAMFDDLDDKQRGYLDHENFESHIHRIDQIKKLLWKAILDATDFDGDGQVTFREFKKMMVLMAIRSPSGHIANFENDAIHIYTVEMQMPLKYVGVCDISNPAVTLEEAMMFLREKVSLYLFYFIFVFEGVLEGKQGLTIEHFTNATRILQPPV